MSLRSVAIVALIGLGLYLSLTHPAPLPPLWLIIAFLGGVYLYSRPHLIRAVIARLRAFGEAIHGVFPGLSTPRIAPMQYLGRLSLDERLNRAKVYSIQLPKGSAWRPELAYALTNKLWTMGEIALRIVGENHAVRWQVIDVTELWLDEGIIVNAIRSVYPDAEITVEPYTTPAFSKPFHRLTAFYQQALEFPRPSAYPHDLNKADPLALIANVMSQAQAGERVSYVVYVGQRNPHFHQQGLHQITRSKWSIGDVVLIVVSCATIAGILLAFGFILYKLFLQKRPEKYLVEDMKVFYGKLGEPLLGSYLMMQIDAATPQRLMSFDLEPALRQFNTPYQQLIWHEDRPDQSLRLVDSAAKVRQTDALMQLLSRAKRDESYRSIFNPYELASLWHLPHEGMTAANVVWQRSKKTPIPIDLKGRDDGVYLGDNVYAGSRTPVYLPDADRATHMAVFGMTGTGKTNFLHTLIAQDIAYGKGVCVVDPLGKLVGNILRYSIPPEREADVVVLDIGNVDYPPPFNLMALPTAANLENAASRVMSVFAKLHPDMPGSRWADTLAMALLTLWGEEQPTIRDVNKVLSDTGYRDNLLARTQNEAVQEFWEEFEARGDRMQEELTAPIKYRIRAFYGNPYFYPLTCHPQPLNFADLLRQRKIILVSLGADEAKIPKREQQLLGALIVSQIQMAAMSRAAEEHGFYLFVDEAQEFITTSLPTMLTQARQFNLSLTLANQYLKQLVGETLEAVRGDVGTFVFFQLGDEDAPIAARYTRPVYESDDFMQMDKYQAAIRMRLGTNTLPAFGLQPRLAFDEHDSRRVQMGMETEKRIRACSQEQYTPMSREDIFDWLSQRYPRKGRGEGGQDEFSDPV